MDCPVTNCPCLLPPQASSNIPPNFRRHKRCRRSLARPNVDNGVAVGRPRRFFIMAPIAFVGGRTDGAVVHHIHGMIE